MGANLERLGETLGRDLFVPLTFRLALRLGQLEWPEFAADPGLASFTLRSASGLFRGDALVNWFDDWMEAETAGVVVERDALGEVQGKPSGLSAPPAVDDSLSAEPLRTVLDLTARLCTEVGDRTAVLGYLTGGATLLGRLYGGSRRDKVLAAMRSGKISDGDKKLLDGAVQLSNAVANAYCERGIGGLVFVEHDPVTDFEYFAAFDAVFNLARYYGVPVMILARSQTDAAMAEFVRRCGAKWMVAPGVGQPDVGVVPLDAFGEAGEDAIGATGSGRGRVFVTEWDLAPDTAPSAVTAMGDRIAERA
jgi:uroporphyrinogen-III decarboxylase